MCCDMSVAPQLKWHMNQSFFSYTYEQKREINMNEP